MLDSFLCWLKDWQVLASGLMAGTLAILLFLIQQNCQRKEAKRVLRRQMHASRTPLSNDLDSFIEYLKKCYTIAAEIRKGEKKVFTPRTPRLPEQILTNLQTLIEHLDDDYKNDVYILTKVADIYQVQNARFRDVLKDVLAAINDPLGVRDDEEYFKDIGRNAVFLYTLIVTILLFARHEQKHISLDFSEATAANSFYVLEGYLPDDLRMDPEDEYKMCAYIVNYVTNQAAKHYFPDYTSVSSRPE